VWLSYLSSATPVDAAASSITGYVLGYGPLGIAAVVMSWLFLKGWRLVSPSRETAIRDSARTEGRADLLKELERVIGEKNHAEEQRDAAMKVAQDQLLPLLLNFTAATESLLPLLRELISHREAKGNWNAPG
jgi:hypothetical protein